MKRSIDSVLWLKLVLSKLGAHKMNRVRYLNVQEAAYEFIYP